MRTPVIMINGFAGAGKSTVCKMLGKEVPVQNVKFSEPLKRMLAELCRCANISEDRIQRILEGTQEEKKAPIPEFGGLSGRHMMITLGSEWRDLNSKTIWVETMAPKIEDIIQENKKLVVIDDHRFDHEREYMLDRFGNRDDCAVFLWKVKGKDYEDIVAKSANAHQSERPMPDHFFDEIIDNDGSLEQLREKMRDLSARIPGLSAELAPSL